MVGLLATLLVLINMPPRTHCQSEPPQTAGIYWFHATQIVVEPWQGRHHVYGLFTIPDKYRFDHLFSAKLVIQGVPEEFQAGSPEDAEMSISDKKPGHYTKRVYLSTRTTLRFLMMGSFGDLKMPCHWWLRIADRGV